MESDLVNIILRKRLIGFPEQYNVIDILDLGDSLNIDVDIHDHLGRRHGRINVVVSIFNKPIDPIIENIKPEENKRGPRSNFKKFLSKLAQIKKKF